ncbi:alpha-l-fucosidase [Colletotrichum plurivorum]|uniref:Alpha-l-fucosidase n=1 Tax=Colletotrichum plurivorum TaxID=2175906 RepID=A0A8H6J8I8_9PEZI|nr:alpha-l-fucosidase [Colletotrichum plurivorum]
MSSRQDGSGSGSSQEEDSTSSTPQSLLLHYDSPASEWSEALPIGNGRLGAVLHGRTHTELLQLNEDSVWYGGPQERTPKDALRHLPRLRQLIRDEKHAEAEALVREAFFATPASMRHYEPLGTCTLEFGHAAGGDGEDITEYRRYLDLETAQTTVEYRHRGVTYRRDAIASFPDNVLAVRVSASEPVRFIVRLDRVSEVEWETNEYLDSIDAVDGPIVLTATPGGRNSNRLAIALGVACDDEGGSVEVVGNALIVKSSSCTVAIGAQTTYRADDPEAAAISDVNTALKRPWIELVERHREDYQSLFTRTSLRMFPDASHVPTDQRIKDNRDPGLVALYHNYGRYLLISSSRKSSNKPLPATLQGIWNPSFAPPWGSKYTININLQMNYWPAGLCNLVADCATPVLDLLERMAERGKKTAREMYGCKGWCAHHNTDIWADTDPQDRWMPSTIWPLGGAWMCVDVFDMLRFSYDEDMHRRAALCLEGCVEFLLDFLVPSACGQYLVTSPSLSPENTFLSESGEAGILCEGSAIDTTIIRLAFEKFLWSTNVLDREHPLRERVKEAMGKLPDLTVNADGLIQEWGLKDYREQEPGHRHVSHLFGVYPGDKIGPLKNPELTVAARKVLERRAAHGGGHTGWSRAWLLNLHARLYDAEDCGRHMDLLLSTSTLPNMLDNHPPFQIDGNFGGCAGVVECLIQSSFLRTVFPDPVQNPFGGHVSIQVLPACPAGWREGEVKGVRLRGGWTASFKWKDGDIVGPLTLKASDRHVADAIINFPNGSRRHFFGARPSMVRDVFPTEPLPGKAGMVRPWG